MSFWVMNCRIQSIKWRRRPRVSAAFFCSVFMLCTFPLSVSAQSTKPAPKAQTAAAATTKLKQILQRYATAETFSGAALIARDGRILLHQAYGLADRAWNLPNRTEARYPFCSITKPFTAALILKEMEKGHLRLEQTVGDILTEFKDKPGGSVTIKQLLTYTSGLANPDNLPPDNNASDAVKESEMLWFYRTPNPEFSLPSVAAKYLLESPSDGKAGTFRYINTDYIVLSAILEKVTGKSYAQLLEAEILKPLGLRDTGLLRANALVPQLTPGWIKTKSGWEREPYVRWENFSGAGALYGTSADLLRWANALMDGKVLGAEQTKAILTVGAGGGFAAFGGFVYSQKFGGKEENIVERQGAIGAHRTLLLLVPEEKIVIILLGNTDQFQNSDTYQEKGLGYELLAATLAVPKM